MRAFGGEAEREVRTFLKTEIILLFLLKRLDR